MTITQSVAPDELILAVEKDLRRHGLAALTPPAPLPRAVDKASDVAGLVGCLAAVPALITGNRVVWLVVLAGGLFSMFGYVHSRHVEGAFKLREVFLIALLLVPFWALLAHFAADATWPEAALGATVGLATVVVCGAVLGAIFRVALTSLSIGALRSFLDALVKSLGAAGVATPVAFVVLLTAFFTNDAWTLVATIPWPRYVGLLAVLLGIVWLSVASVVWPERSRLLHEELPEYGDELVGWCNARRLVPASLRDLTLLQRINVFMALGSRILGPPVAMWLLVALLFTIIGLVAVDDTMAVSLTGEQDATGGLSWTLIGLSALFGAVASLTYAAGAHSDRGQRDELVAQPVAPVGKRLAAWRWYKPLADDKALDRAVS